MRIRLAKKILKRPERYSWRQYRQAAWRLGWKWFTCRTAAFVTLVLEQS